MFQRPPRLILTNLDTQEALRAQFNPKELALGIKAVYQKTVIPGMSHTLRQFSHTDDLTLGLELYFKVSAPKSEAMRNGIYTTEAVFPDAGLEPFTLDDRIAAEQFLYALAVPRGDEDLISRNSPPSVLVVWPNFLSFEAIVLGVDFKYTTFNVKAEPVEFTAMLQLEEFRDMRYTSLDARIQGFTRDTRFKLEEP